MTNAREGSAHLALLLRSEHAAMAEFLLALAEFDRRRHWLELGHASLFAFLHRELGLSKGAAYYRKTASDLVQRFPEVLPPLRDGRLCITSVIELAKVLTPENRHEVLPRFFHASKHEAKAVAAALRPAEAAPHREVVTAVSPARPAPVVARGITAAPAAVVAPSSGRLLAPAVLPANGPTGPAGSAATQVPANEPTSEPERAVHPDEPRACQVAETPRNSVEPLTADLRRLHVTVSSRFLEKLEAARARLTHTKPGAGAAEVLEAALDLLLVHLARRKGIVDRPRAARSGPDLAGSGGRASGNDGPDPRYVPAAVRREVWTRDGGRCQWPLASSGVCGSTFRVELDHAVPLARGGASVPANLRLLCRVHNDLAARRALGDTCMDRYTRGAIRGR